MLFNSFQFLWVFPIIFVVCWACNSVGKSNRTLSNAALLIASYGLYIHCNPVATIFLLAVTFITYFAALLIERQCAYGCKKYLISIGILLAFLPLLVFKYYKFLSSILTDVLAVVGIENPLPGLNWVVPLGISFFTFQAVGYLWDVYYRRTKAEHNWWDYMLFVGFFPQIASGPISKANDLLPQIKANRRFDSEQVTQGFRLFLWGMFLKVVMADRVGLLVDSIYKNYEYSSGTTCILAAILYSFQIYGDFAGYSTMAVGVGKMLGFDLVNNFRRPYLAASVTEFWRRWHISLTRWLTDYVYIPLGGSRCSKLRNYSNIMVTFLVSGIWHGANWTFIVWGLLHGAFQTVEKVFHLQKCENKSVRLFRIVVTFALVSLAWVFFRMPSLEQAWAVMAKMFTCSGPMALTATNSQKLILAFALMTVVLADLIAEFYPKFSLLGNRYMPVRWLTYLFLICSIVLCGVLDAGSFIYVSF